jgi:hypothetical protein
MPIYTYLFFLAVSALPTALKSAVYKFRGAVKKSCFGLALRHPYFFFYYTPNGYFRFIFQCFFFVYHTEDDYQLLDLYTRYSL